MTPEDWKTGMENEAASVTDQPWAVQTRRAAVNRGFRPFTLLGALLGMTLLTLTLNATVNAVMLGYLAPLRPIAGLFIDCPIKPVWVITLGLGWFMTQRGARTGQTFLAFFGSVAAASILTHTLNLTVPIQWDGVTGATADLLPSAEHTPPLMILALLAINALFLTAGVLLNRVARPRRTA